MAHESGSCQGFVLGKSLTCPGPLPIVHMLRGAALEPVVRQPFHSQGFPPEKTN
jgi:hypothetical protein